MAKKYIDAERLREGLKELESVIHSDQLVGQSMHPYDCGQLHAINTIKEFINSLQQEQPCDTCTNDKGCVTCKDGELWKGKEQTSEDFEKEWDEFEDWTESYITSDYPTYYGPKQIARHFYELGKGKK